MTFNDLFPVIPGPLISSDPIFAKLETLKIEDVYKYQISKFIFKSLNHLAPSNFHQWFKLNSEIHEHRTRTDFNISNNTSSHNLFIPSARTINYGLKRIKVNGPKIWNALPNDIKSKSLNVFLKANFVSMYG